MTGQQVRRSLVEKLWDSATTGRFVWRSNELCRRARGGIAQTGGCWLAMNVALTLTKTRVWARGVRDLGLACRSINRRRHPRPPVDDHGRGSSPSLPSSLLLLPG
jgi:hypothetical protein